MNHTKKNLFAEYGWWTLGIALAWLVPVCYHEGYWLFDHWHLSSPLTDKVLFHVRDTGWLDPSKARLIIFFFLVVSCVGMAEGKAARFSRRVCWRCIWIGAVGFLGGPLIFARAGDLVTTYASFLLATVGGFFLFQVGCIQLLRHYPLNREIKDPFGKSQGGFPQEERKLDSDFSLHLRGEYAYKGEKKESWINLLNPRRGILVLGSPGSGKSRFIVEPLLRQWMEKGHALFLFDYKYDALTRLAFEYFGRYRNHFPDAMRFYSINFSDLSRSHRCNLLDPSTLDWPTDALGAARTILLSMNPSWAEKQGEFFVESPINFLGAIIWWLRKHKSGQFCTLPHAIEMAQLPYDKLFTLLNTEPEIQTLINPFIVAYRNKTFEMLDGQITSAKIPLARLASPNVYFVLTGNDCSLQLNDPTAPKILCLGGDPARQEALAPVLSLYIDRINTLCNRPGRVPLALFCDEFATVRAYSMTSTIATGRSNNLVPLIAVQDLTQLRTRYSRDEAELFLTITGNLFCGQVGGATADWVSKRFPRIQRERISVSENDDRSSVNTSQQWEPTVEAATIAGLSAGEFVGLVADDPGQEMEYKAFHARLIRESAEDAAVKSTLPVLRQADEKMAMEAFRQVKEDIKKSCDEECGRILNDRGLMGFVVK